MRAPLLTIAALAVACAGCEQGGASDDAPSASQTMAPPAAAEPAPPPSAASTSSPGSAGSSGSPASPERRSALGKAYGHAENVVDRAEQEQQKLIEQMEDDGGD